MVGVFTASKKTCCPKYESFREGIAQRLNPAGLEMWGYLPEICP